MLCLIAVGAVAFTLNFSATVTKGEMFATVYDPNGSFGPMHDTLSLARGFPLRYQQSEEWFRYKTLTDAQIDTWQRNIGVRVTHVHWLLINMLLALSAAVILARAAARLMEQTRVPRRGNAG